MMNKEIYLMSDKCLQNTLVKIANVNLDSDLKNKLEQINLFQNQIIFICKSDDKNIIQFVIDNAKYAIRSIDAKNIFVKKVNNI